MSMFAGTRMAHGMARFNVGVLDIQPPAQLPRRKSYTKTIRVTRSSENVEIDGLQFQPQQESQYPESILQSCTSSATRAAVSSAPFSIVGSPCNQNVGSMSLSVHMATALWKGASQLFR